MDFPPRIRQIFMILLKQEGSISIKALAEQIHVSKRTVQRELEFVPYYLRDFNILLETKTGKGIWLTGTEADKEALQTQLLEQDVMDATDKEQRRKRLIMEMLKDKSSKKLYYYSNIFGVSETTISNDMEAIQQWFDRFGLQISRKQGVGVMLEGREQDFRAAVSTFIDENIENTQIRDLFQNHELTVFDIIASKGPTDVYGILNQDITKRVLACVKGVKNSYIRQMTEDAYIGLLLHVTIAVNRILNQEVIEDDFRFEDVGPEDDAYITAKQIVSSLEEEFEIQIPEVECYYITLHIKGAKLQQSNENTPPGDDIEYNLDLINRMIEAFDRNNAYGLKQDEEFISGLMGHLQPTIVRLKNHMRITNPLLQQIQETYGDVYQKCIQVAEVLEKELDCKVPPEEVGYLVMHFGAALVRLEELKDTRRRVEVGIVCASGIGISRLMASRLNHYLKKRANITAFGKADLVPAILKRQDFLVSSIQLDTVDADILYVSPLLTDQDLDQIDKKVQYYAKIPKPANESGDFNNQLDEVAVTVAKIKSVIDEFRYIFVRQDITFDRLVEVIASEHSTYLDKQQEIVDDINSREQISTQIIPELKLALLHAKTTGVERPVLSVTLPKGGACFTDAYFQNITCVITMLVPEKGRVKGDVELFGYISEQLVENESFRYTLMQGDTVQTKDCLAKELKKYFTQYLEKI